jgi:DNA-binding PadR family transcriptional regulator
LLDTETEHIGKRVRKYYRLNKKGNAKTEEKVNEFSAFLETMRFLLDIKTAV